ncbi:hypothetical protein [Sphingomonas sp. GC_Shp_3]|uniref:hypothetical protein n=1 Tax=Sphingomonas sp. GC_Shp_3 TaxID=2937383 RepID=UPI00226A66F2|nr:hypothetical protein [Sphingomonas sp. GC_Shp_3]
MNPLGKRLTALEHAQPSATPRWYCLRRYEDESEADAVAAYEAENGPIGDGNVVMRVIVSKPGTRAAL